MEPVVAVIIPTRNEADSIAFVIRELPANLVRQVIVVDANSTDGTQAIARAAGAMVIDAGKGYGRACAAGAAAADPACEVLVFLDGDGADRGDLLHRIAGPVIEGTHDFVLASRTRALREPGSMSWHQVLAGQVFGFLIFVRFGKRYSDMCAFRAIRRDTLAKLGMREEHFGWNIEMQMQAARLKLRIQEVPMPYRCRMGGESKVAGSLGGTLRAAKGIVGTYVRIAFGR